MTQKNIFIILFAALAGTLALVPLILSLYSKDGNIPGLGLEGAIFCAFWGLALFLVLRRAWPFIAPFPSILIGAFMAAKPKLVPVVSFWKGQRDPFPLFSETHLYFIIPGAALVIICFFFLLKGEEE